MKIIGITGASGVGKSTVAKKLEALGAVHLDADKYVHILQKANTAYTMAIAKTFGSDVLLDSGDVDRAKLGAKVFSDKGELAKLNALTQKYVVDYLNDKIAQAKQAGAKAVVVDAVGLHESGIYCDVRVAVVATREEQIMRIMERDNLPKERVILRLDAQKPQSFFVEHADLSMRSDEELPEKLLF